LGIVYTPNEIVRFMIESVDYLVHKHFGKLLADPGVEILDPATGTGTFITELIEYLPKDKLRYKYKHEMHCNEVAILPYYIANLNIEFTYKQKMGEYEEFEHICFVDTLDHAASNIKQMDLFAMSAENTQRIHNQNDRNISVIIGNPPYNARQENFNQGNANRSYEAIDKCIKYSYVKEGKAQNQIVVYDMYTRFIRWASDRLNKDGIIAFICNSSFLDARSFDGFRKCIEEEFTCAYFIDLGGNVRKISGKDGIFICEKHTIFGTAAMTGIAILFLVKDSQATGNKIFYANPFHVHELREVKLSYLQSNKFSNVCFEHIIPDKKYNWLNQSDNDFDQLLPLIDKEVKSGKSEKAVFKLFSLGIDTHRDAWVYDVSQNALQQKIKYFIMVYERTLKDENYAERMTIKWDSELTQYLIERVLKKFEPQKIVRSLYRPYTKQFFYFDKHFNFRTFQWFKIFEEGDLKQKYIAFVTLGNSKPFHCLSSSSIIDLHFTGDSQCLPLYYYEKEGNRIDNITDWGLQQFQKHYNDKTITKLDIFHYTYAVLHYPEYRSKYELNLKREFPRLPFYDNFSQWVEWGSKLMELHINYETVAPYPLTRIDTNNNLKPKPKLKADREKNSINLDDITFLQDIPKIAWEYKLGNRSALEWILDQYKEKKPKDQTIAERFNNYRFADYKETVIDLLQRVCTVSVETMKIIEAMRH
jgi:predicted helicase